MGKADGRPGSDARFEVYKDRQKQYRWRFRRADGEPVAESSTGYNNKADCLAQIEFVRKETRTAPMIDPTITFDDVETKPRKGRGEK